MSAQIDSSSRIDILARAKKVPPEFQEDRRSVYWIDRLPPTPQNGTTTVIVATPRIQALAEPRRAVMYKGDRPTPIWGVSSSAMKAKCTARIEQLGQAKNLNPQYSFDRSAYMEVTPAAQKARDSQRLESLSKPVERKMRPEYTETEWGQTFPVLPAAKKANASERLEQLAESKKYHPQFRDEKPIQWPVGDSAMKAIATVRLQQLSRPKSRTMVKDDYDPYKVTVASKRARATPRLEELCVPIPRKVRPKKQ